MEPTDAMKVFMERSMLRAYKAALEDIDSLLKSGPIGAKPKTDEVELHNWHKSLDDKDKLMVERAVRNTAFNVIFGFLVVLDNLSMGYPIEGVVSDFALYVQSYSDKASRSNNQPKESVRINHPKNNIHLHDQSRSILDD